MCRSVHLGHPLHATHQLEEARTQQEVLLEEVKYLESHLVEESHAEAKWRTVQEEANEHARLALAEVQSVPDQVSSIHARRASLGVQERRFHAGLRCAPGEVNASHASGPKLWHGHLVWYSTYGMEQELARIEVRAQNATQRNTTSHWVHRAAGLKLREATVKLQGLRRQLHHSRQALEEVEHSRQASEELGTKLHRTRSEEAQRRQAMHDVWVCARVKELRRGAGRATAGEEDGELKHATHRLHSNITALKALGVRAEQRSEVRVQAVAAMQHAAGLTFKSRHAARSLATEVADLKETLRLGQDDVKRRLASREVHTLGDAR